MIPGPRRLRDGIAGLGLILVLAAWPAVGAPESAASPAPTLSVTPDAASMGSTVAVQGQGFPPQVYDLQISVCGNMGLGGSGDCNPASARTVFTGNGSFAVNLPAATPPKPCPCVIMAFAPALASPVTVPFTVIGAPVATPAAAPPAFEQKTLKVENAKLEGDGGWQAWFGASTTRHLVFTIQNTGATAADNPPLVLTAGKGDNPERVVTAPRIGRIEPGARRTVRAAVPFDTFSFGSYTVEGRVGNTGAEETFRAHTSTYPWGLFVLAILVLQLVLLGMRNVLRRRIAAREAKKQAATQPEAPVALVTAVHDAVGSEEGWPDDDWAEDDWTDEEWAEDDVESEPAETVPERASTEIHWRLPATDRSESDEKQPALAGKSRRPSNE